ncbi:hypothetical protein ISS04_03435 [Candidatus Woesearchaeota archaeon]|nr:hypothetical protein [Candidatus Woesearchaeota archaeon]
MPQKVSRDTPLSEITLRKYEKPYDLEDRELVKKICLSIGLLQPGDSRDVISDILLILIKSKHRKENLTSKEIEEKVIKYRKENELPLLGIAPSNIRRQLKRLKDLYLIENIDSSYRIYEFEQLNKIFEEKIEGFYLKNILSRVKEYLQALEKPQKEIESKEIRE